MDRITWASQFAMQMQALGATLSHAELFAYGYELYESARLESPLDAALVAFERFAASGQWPTLHGDHDETMPAVFR
jgi:hypothetical protein